jgi:hypothetical protein
VKEYTLLAERNWDAPATVKVFVVEVETDEKVAVLKFSMEMFDQLFPGQAPMHKAKGPLVLSEEEA